MFTVLEHTKATTRKTKPVKRNLQSSMKTAEQVERSDSSRKQQGSLKRAPLRDNLNQVAQYVNVPQFQSESDSESESMTRDSRFAGKLIGVTS